MKMLRKLLVEINTLNMVRSLLLTGILTTTMASATDIAPDQQLLSIMQRWIDAELRHDGSAMDQILDDRFVATFDGSKLISKADYVKALTSGPVDPTAIQQIYSDQVIIDGNTGVIIVDNQMHGTSKDKTYDILIRATVTFIKHDGVWKAVAIHGSKITS